jgi:ABC-2 type transport system ATP-binding protein
VHGLNGPKGAGKTTTIKILVGQMRPTSGTARIAGCDCLTQSRRIKRLVGYMPDVFGSYDNMRVREYLDFFGAAFGIARRQRTARIDEVLEMTGATYMQDRFVESLSHGMRQRVGIARTLLHDPQVLILDEPANGLDPHARIEMREILLRLAAMGKTLIITSHILPEISRICDRLAIITHGKLRAFGTLPEIMRTVRQRRSVEVQLVDVQQLARAEEIVKSLLEADANVHSSATEVVVRFETSQEESRMAEVLSALVRAEIKISQFRELQADLEDTFLSITRQSEEIESRAASAGSGGGQSALTGTGSAGR